MRALVPLIRREFWEWQAAFVRAPIVLCGVMAGLLLVAVFTNSDKIQRVVTTMTHGSASHTEMPEEGVGAAAHARADRGTADIWTANPDALGQGLAAVYAVFILVLLLVIPTYLSGTLHHDRRDRSILFWKSLPIPEHQTVLAKLCVAVFALPAAYAAAAVVTGAMFLLTLAAGGLILDFPLPWPMDFARALLLSLPCLIVAWLLLALWSLPVFCWLLLCSAWAKKMAFLLAMVVPLAVAVLEYWLFDSRYLVAALGDQLAAGLGSFVEVLPHPENIVSTLRKSLYAPAFWCGLIISILQLGACVWLRENRFEI